MSKNNKNARFFAVFNKFCKEMRISDDNRSDARKVMISQYYPDKSSLTELNANQIDYLCEKMIAQIEPELPLEATQDGDKMRKSIIAILCNTFGMTKKRGDVIIPDMVRINQFLCEKTAFKCPLNALTIEQLPKVVTQMRLLQKNEIAAKRKKMEVRDGN